MPADSLAALIKLRQSACEQALRRLASTLADEDQAERQVHLIERAIAEETEAASSTEGSDATVEAFAAWLPTARRKAESARRTLADRQADTVRARAELAVCRSALDAAEMLQQQRLKAKEQNQTPDLEDRPAQTTAWTQARSDEA